MIASMRNTTYSFAGTRYAEIGDVSARQKLKTDLQCHSFEWFLDHVYKDSTFPRNHIYIGQVIERKLSFPVERDFIVLCFRCNTKAQKIASMQLAAREKRLL